MPLSQRVLKVTISLPGGDVVLDENLSLRVTVHKAALAIQNRATVEVMGMTTSLRLRLLTQLTAWHKRQVSAGQASQDWINIKIEAGYVSADNSGIDSVTTIFTGQVVNLDQTSPPPNIGVRMQCFTRQIDKTTYLTKAAPTSGTFLNLVKFAADQIGIDYVCETSYSDKIIPMAFRTIYTTGALLIGIQDLYRPDVAAFIDDDQLIVKDRNKIINTAQIAQVTEFIGTPLWTEWGVEWQGLMNPAVKLAGAANLTSLMNPGVNGMYVITELQYQLTSREGPFYVKANASPPA